MSLTPRRPEIGEKVRRVAAHLLLCFVVALQLGSAAAGRMDVKSGGNPELAALASAIGQPIALCHDAAENDPQPGNASHHGCCDCGMCTATAHAPPPVALAYVAAQIATRKNPEHPAPLFRLVFVPRVAATSPRGPPLDV